MSPETTGYLELLDQRITLLHALSDALLAARTDVVALDLNGLEDRIADQHRLCQEIRRLDSHIDQLQGQGADPRSAGPDKYVTRSANQDDRSLHDTLDRLHGAEVRVKQLNDAHQALLHRSRWTVGALLNSYRSFALTYSDPSSIRSLAGERS